MEAVNTAETESSPSTVSSDIPEVHITGEIKGEIPTNASVNHIWGGGMCEAGGLIYYISDGGKGEDSPLHIVRMKVDGSQSKAVTGEYARIYGLTADEKNLYFMAATSQEGEDSAFYALPLNGGDEKKLLLCDWEYGFPQTAGGRLYWEKDSEPNEKSNVVNIMCMDPDGSDIRQLFSVPVPYGSPFCFLATGNGLYYAFSNGEDRSNCTLFHTDLNGNNREQLCKSDLEISSLLYDQGNVYFTALHIEGGMYTSVYRLDENDVESVVLERISYFPQDEAVNYFYGISGGVIYYFDFGKTGEDQYAFVLHSYDIITKQDAVIFLDEQDNPYLHSIRGKTIDVQSIGGFYILGNDIYYKFFNTP